MIRAVGWFKKYSLLSAKMLTANSVARYTGHFFIACHFSNLRSRNNRPFSKRASSKSIFFIKANVNKGA